MDKTLTRCINLPDKDEALSCLKSRIKDDSGSCKARFVFLESSNCDSCKKARNEIKRDIKNEVITVCDIDSEEGKDIMRRNSLSYVPALLLLDCHNRIIYPDE